jgi:zinc transport system substrate-binding protein
MALSRAMIYFETGIPFEKRIVDKIKHSGIKILLIDSSKGIKRIPMSEGILSGGEHDEHHDEHHEAHHGGREALDPHVWNSVKNLEIMSANILDGLCKAAPSSKDYFKKNYGELVSELKKLDGEIATLLNPFRGRAFFVFHPAFGYFAESYGLKQRAIEIDGKSPSPKQIRALIAKARREKVKIIFVEPQFGDESARTVAKALDGAVMVINPLPENPVDNFRNIAEKLKKAFTGVE